MIPHVYDVSGTPIKIGMFVECITDRYLSLRKNVWVKVYSFSENGRCIGFLRSDGSIAYRYSFNFRVDEFSNEQFAFSRVSRVSVYREYKKLPRQEILAHLYHRNSDKHLSKENQGKGTENMNNSSNMVFLVTQIPFDDTFSEFIKESSNYSTNLTWESVLFTSLHKAKDYVIQQSKIHSTSSFMISRVFSKAEPVRKPEIHFSDI